MLIRNYTVQSLLGKGQFGEVYIGTHVNTKERIAIKISSEKDEWSIKNEVNCYMRLRGVQGIPKMRAFGKIHKQHYMVMDLLGASLEDLQKTKAVFSPENVCRIGTQILSCLKHIHDCGLVHRDIKPANILFKKNVYDIYLCDFGLATSYLDSNNNHIEKQKSAVGTQRYMSIHVHQNIFSVRRDDVESVGYILWEMLEDKLPWSNESEKDIVERKKQSFLPKHLALQLFILHCRQLDFYQSPNYLLLRGYLKRFILQD